MGAPPALPVVEEVRIQEAVIQAVALEALLETTMAPLGTEEVVTPRPRETRALALPRDQISMTAWFRPIIWLGWQFPNCDTTILPPSRWREHCTTTIMLRGGPR